MEAVAGADLGAFFAAHVERPGAARLEATLSDLRDATGGGYDVAFTLEQTQDGEPLALDVPVVVQTTGKAVSTVVHMTGRMAATTVRTDAEPVALHVDPQFDLFRMLDPRETAPSIGQIFGEPKILAVLPAAAPAAEQDGYRKLIEGWRSDAHQPEIVSDAEVKELPADRAVWLLGRQNALAAKLFASGGDYTLGADELAVDRESMPLAGHTVVVVRRHPKNLEKAIGWIFADGQAPLPGLGRKLPHYGKYSYLGFEGDEPVNVLKGQWTATDSPLRVDLRPTAERGRATAALALPARQALAELPPVFSQKALLEHVQWLSAPEREGRGIGTKGLDAAADYVAAAFKAMGLSPGGDDGTYFQSFAAAKSPTGAPVTLRNVIGVLPGTKAEWAGQSALLTAHYDHLGAGWPDVHKGDEGKLHPGADDNASGVAVMLELAKALASGEKPQRTIVFVAFSGEEAGLLGSKHYAEHPAFPLDKTIGVINLDTVGRLFDKKISVIATGSASEWQHIFRGAGFVTGVEGRMIPDALESSDQKSFIDKGVPAVQIFTDPHADYHRPGDTADKIDGPGLVKVATFVKEGIVYLGEREQPLTNTIASMKGASPAAGRQRRQRRPPPCRRLAARQLRHHARLRVRGPRREGRGCHARLAGREGRRQGGRRAPQDRRQGRRQPAGLLDDPPRPLARPDGEGPAEPRRAEPVPGRHRRRAIAARLTRGASRDTITASREAPPMKARLAALAVVAFAALPALAQQQDFSKVEVKAQKLSEGVYMLTGSGGNIGLSVGKDGCYVIDDQYAPLTDKILAAVKAISPAPVRFVVNTHWHGDHTGGNENMGKTGALLVAHENVRRRMSTEQFSAAFGRKTEASPEAALPVVTFTDAVTFHWNGDEIRVYHVPPAHTDGDAVIHFVKADVVHMGDVFFNGTTRSSTPRAAAGSTATSRRRIASSPVSPRRRRSSPATGRSGRRPTSRPSGKC